MLDFLAIVILLLLTVGSTILNSISGGGMGIILVPALVIFYRFSPSLAIGTVFLAALAGAISSMLAYSAQGMVDYRAGTALGLTAIPGIAIGSAITNLVPIALFNPILGIVIVGLALLTVYQPRLQWRGTTNGGDKISAGSDQAQVANWKRAVPLVMLTGLFAGTFGAGGGLILTPSLLMVGFPVLLAVGTNRLIALVYITGAVALKSYLGDINLDFGIWLIIGALVGGVLGARVAKLQSSDVLRKTVAVIVLVFGLVLIFEAVF